jgi:beta-glucanase (GH16 family)
LIKDPDQFHTYAAEWTPDSITITFDGQTCMSTRWDQPGPLQKPAPFDRPFHLNLTQGLGIGQNPFDPERTPLPATLEVDHVRVWG